MLVPRPRFFVGTGQVQRRIISWELAHDAITRRQLSRIEADLSRAPRTAVHQHGFYVRFENCDNERRLRIEAFCLSALRAAASFNAERRTPNGER